MRFSVQRGPWTDFNIGKILEDARDCLVKRLIKIVGRICKKRGDRNDSVSSMKIIEAENEKRMDSSNDLVRLLKGSSKGSLLMDKEGANERKGATLEEDEGGVAARSVSGRMEKREETGSAKKRGRKRCSATERKLEVKTVESEETMVDPSLEEKFLVSILEESGVLRATSKELLSIQMNVLRKSVHPSRDRISEQEHEDDEDLTADSEKIPVAADSHQEESKEEERKEEKRKEEGEAGKEEKADETVVEIEAGVTRSSRNDLGCENDRREKEEKVGSPPDVDTLKNSNATESTIFLSRS